MELLKKLDGAPCEICLYIILGQGELGKELPSHVRLLNRRFSQLPLWGTRGTVRMMGTMVCALFRNGGIAGKLRSLAKNGIAMVRNRRVQIDKLLWPLASDGAWRFDETFDLAVAFIEGASAYYVANHVKARKKAAFIHIDYRCAGYTREMDGDCWNRFDRIFAVSREAKEGFAACYPEQEKKLFLFHNLIDREKILRLAEEQGGFSDDYDGARILTVGRLVHQKGYDIAVEAMGILKAQGYRVRWYALGEGSQRKSLEAKIAALGLQEDFLLPGAVENPYPYYRQADLYVHASRFEGKSIAIQEAQILGCAIIASDCSGNREQIADGQDGLLCSLSPESIAGCIAHLLEQDKMRETFGRAAAAKAMGEQRAQTGKELQQLLELMA